MTADQATAGQTITGQAINDPRTVAEVSAAFARHEEAPVANEVATHVSLMA